MGYVILCDSDISQKYNIISKTATFVFRNRSIYFGF